MAKPTPNRFHCVLPEMEAHPGTEFNTFPRALMGANLVGEVGPKVWAVAPTDFRAHENSRPTLAENCTKLCLQCSNFVPPVCVGEAAVHAQVI